LSLTDWESIFSIDEIDKITTDISNTILSAAEATIPNKLVTIRKQDSAWLTNEIRKLIRKKNRIHNKAKRLNKPADWNKFRKIRNDVTSLVRKARDVYQDKPVSRLSDDHPSTCNQISGLKPSHYGIPPLLKNNNFIFNELDKGMSSIISLLCKLILTTLRPYFPNFLFPKTSFVILK
jgi:hypothetical protein